MKRPPITKTELRERLLRIHNEAAPSLGDYHSYGSRLEGEYYLLLCDLGLSDKFKVEGLRGEGDWIDEMVVRPRVPETTIPDVSDWTENDVRKPVNIDECVEFWWKFAKTGKPE